MIVLLFTSLPAMVWFAQSLMSTSIYQESGSKIWTGHVHELDVCWNIIIGHIISIYQWTSFAWIVCHKGPRGTQGRYSTVWRKSVDLGQSDITHEKKSVDKYQNLISQRTGRFHFASTRKKPSPASPFSASWHISFGIQKWLLPTNENSKRHSCKKEISPHVPTTALSHN